MASTDTDISEKFSEKPKRGRPPAMPAEWERLMVRAGAFGDAKSRRSHVDFWYVCGAISALEDTGHGFQEPYAWLVNDKNIRKTVLAELGRIQDEEAIRLCAAKICELKPKTKDAVAMIRRWRGVNRKKPSCLDLTSEIIATVNDYLRRYPATTWQQVTTALENAMDLAQQSNTNDEMDLDETQAT